MYWTICDRPREGPDEGRQGPHLITQSSYILIILFIYPGRGVPPPPPRITLFAMSPCTDPKYTTPVTITNRTHTYPQSYTPPPCLSEARAPPHPMLTRLLPAARTHIFSHLRPLISSPLTGPQGLVLSLRDFLALSLPPAPLKSLLSIYESSSFSLCVSLSISLPLFIIPFFSRSLFSQESETEKGVAFSTQEPQPSPFVLYYKQTPHILK